MSLLWRTDVKRTLILSTLLLVGLASMSARALQQAGQPAPMVVEVDKVRDNLYVMKGGGGNSAVFITATGVTVVDTKNPGWGQPLLDKIRTVTDKPVTRIINTHTHGDHVSGNVEFPANIEIVVQENTKANMQAMRAVTGLAAPPAGPNIFERNNGKGLPTRTFKDTLTLGSGAERIDLRFFGPAHTGGDAFVIFPALRVMHAGDAFHTRDLPIMDKNNGGTGVDYARTLTRAADAAGSGIDTIINGHNATTTTVADLRTQAAFLGDFVAFVQNAKKSGKTVEDVVKTWTTPAKYTGYAKAAEGRIRADAQVIWDETK